MQCHDSDNYNTQYNLLAKKNAEECRELVNIKPSVPPCERPNRKPPTLHTFCNHNINIQYKYEGGEKGIIKPCGICIRVDENGKKQSPCPVCTKQEMKPEEKLAEAIKCIASPLPRWFNEPERSDPMSVCCRMFGGIKKCPRKVDPCSCQEKGTSNVDKFSVHYPPNKLIPPSEMQRNIKCKPNFRCQGPKGDDTPEVRRYQRELEMIENYFPKNKFCVPRYTNQNYGWLDNEQIRKLEFCDASRVAAPKVLQNLKSHENRVFDPIQLQYCLCHNLHKQMDHWKIV
ncbi:uncharacterized protein LOC101460399 isoform X2 [Ceratitis capitata]|uniref:Uncharacterized protein n=2 Tax=Ceratitis capitata TaxID=7213 RepID=W8CAV9_CERCA|nr:uncharacterized protein LOC101460399 isoform X2 [Ceratitis capitata]